MRNGLWGSTIAMAAVVVVLSLASVPTAGQTPTADAKKTSDPPRTADGKPDMQGYWVKGPGANGYSIEGTFQAPNGAVLGTITAADPFRIAPPAPARASQERASSIVDPPDGRLPYQPWAAAKRKEIADNQANAKWEYVDPQARCFLDLVPRIMYQPENPFQILQLPEYVVILYEWTHAYRIIPMDGRPHVGEDIKLWMGNSRGHWEGHTLVVDVTNINDMNFFDTVGTFHSDAMHVVERWTLVDADRINYEVTIEDPQVFTRPWKMAFPFLRNKDKGFELLEHACHEGERDANLMTNRSSIEKKGEK